MCVFSLVISLSLFVSLSPSPLLLLLFSDAGPKGNGHL